MNLPFYLYWIVQWDTLEFVGVSDCSSKHVLSYTTNRNRIIWRLDLLWRGMDLTWYCFMLVDVCMSAIKFRNWAFVNKIQLNLMKVVYVATCELRNPRFSELSRHEFEFRLNESTCTRVQPATIRLLPSQSWPTFLHKFVPPANFPN